LAAHQAQFVRPLELRLSDATVFSLPAPTQGLASLAILGIYGRLRISWSKYDHLTMGAALRAGI
jgi:gamma-glutamyltranspeptidase/glutathione hydrolase